MEWLVLVLAVPAVLIPVIVIWGFSGCSFSPVILPDAPTNVSAVGTGVSSIRVTWVNPDADVGSFRIERTKEGESTPTVLSSPTTTFDDPALEEATTYSYKVSAIRASDNEHSVLSLPASGRTFGVAFEATLTTDFGGLEGFCLVQRIEPARLLQSTLPGNLQTPGAGVQITLRGSTQADSLLDRIYISRVAPSGDPYDSGADLTLVATSVFVGQGQTVDLPPIDYDLDKTQPLLIAFDVSATSGLGKGRFVTGVPPTEAVTYLRAATAEASVSDRSPSAANPGAQAYQASPGIYLVERIQVV